MPKAEVFLQSTKKKKSIGNVFSGIMNLFKSKKPAKRNAEENFMQRE